jgi:Protein of unknown function (DUF3304)
MIDTMKRTLIKALTLGAVSGCASAEPKGRSVSTVKYNYTDRYIGDVVVDGAWAGGVDAHGGGGDRIQGLMAPSNSSRVAVLNVKWVVADVYDIATNKYSRRTDEPHQASVEVARPYPANPSYLVLHFYQDGHVEAELEADRPKRRIPAPAGYHR